MKGLHSELQRHELSLGVAHKMRIRKSFVNGKWGVFADNQFIY